MKNISKPSVRVCTYLMCIYVKISRSSLQKMEKNMATWSFRTRQEPLMPRSDLNSPGVGDFDTMDYVCIEADVTLFQNSNQLNVRRIRKAGEGEYIESDYLPVSKRDIGKMYEELLAFIKSVKNPYLNRLLSSFFVDDAAFAKAFQFHSAAKTVHHGFVGGLLEHTLSVTKLCDYYAGYYKELNRDLLITAAIFHDIGKTKELSRFPENDYTDDGQLLGISSLARK